MSRNVPPSQRVTLAQAAALAAGAGLTSASSFVAGTNVPVANGSAVTPVQPGTERIRVTSTPQTAARNPSSPITNRWSEVPVRTEGVITDQSYVDITNLARYIPVTRIEEVNGPKYPDPLGNNLAISRTVFGFNFTGEIVYRSNSRLVSPTTAATSVSGL